MGDVTYSWMVILRSMAGWAKSEPLEVNKFRVSRQKLLVFISDSSFAGQGKG